MTQLVAEPVSALRPCVCLRILSSCPQLVFPLSFPLTAGRCLHIHSFRDPSCIICTRYTSHLLTIILLYFVALCYIVWALTSRLLRRNSCHYCTPQPGVRKMYYYLYFLIPYIRSCLLMYRLAVSTL